MSEKFRSNIEQTPEKKGPSIEDTRRKWGNLLVEIQEDMEHPEKGNTLRTIGVFSDTTFNEVLSKPQHMNERFHYQRILEATKALESKYNITIDHRLAFSANDIAEILQGNSDVLSTALKRMEQMITLINDQLKPFLFKKGSFSKPLHIVIGMDNSHGFYSGTSSTNPYEIRLNVYDNENQIRRRFYKNLRRIALLENRELSESYSQEKKHNKVLEQSLNMIERELGIEPTKDGVYSQEVLEKAYRLKTEKFDGAQHIQKIDGKYVIKGEVEDKKKEKKTETLSTKKEEVKESEVFLDFLDNPKKFLERAVAEANVSLQKGQNHEFTLLNKFINDIRVLFHTAKHYNVTVDGRTLDLREYYNKVNGEKDFAKVTKTTQEFFQVNPQAVKITTDPPKEKVKEEKVTSQTKEQKETTKEAEQENYTSQFEQTRSSQVQTVENIIPEQVMEKIGARKIVRLKGAFEKIGKEHGITLEMLYMGSMARLMEADTDQKFSKMYDSLVDHIDDLSETLELLDATLDQYPPQLFQGNTFSLTWYDQWDMPEELVRGKDMIVAVGNNEDVIHHQIASWIEQREGQHWEKIWQGDDIDVDFQQAVPFGNETQVASLSDVMWCNTILHGDQDIEANSYISGDVRSNRYEKGGGFTYIVNGAERQIPYREFWTQSGGVKGTFGDRVALDNAVERADLWSDLMSGSKSGFSSKVMSCEDPLLSYKVYGLIHGLLSSKLSHKFTESFFASKGIQVNELKNRLEKK